MESTLHAGVLFRSWIRASALGWLLGLILVVVLAMIWDVVGGGAQFMVGVGMGAGVGYMQGRVARTWIGRTQPWVWSSIAGMGAPFVVWDAAAAFGAGSAFSFPVCALLGGLLTGTIQRRLLKPSFRRTWWWIPACVLGWGLPAGSMALGATDFLRPAFNLLSTAMFFLGGLVLGAVTGKTLDWMRDS